VPLKQLRHSERSEESASGVGKAPRLNQILHPDKIHRDSE